MIENVGYLDQTKNIVTDEDLEFKKASFAVAEETLFNTVGANFCWYNKYIVCFHGWLRMKKCSIVGGETVICKLPIKPLSGEALICGYYNNGDTSVIPVIDKEGNLMLNNNLEVSANSFIDFIGTFPIVGGGVTLSKLLQLLSLKFRKVVAVC